MRAPTLALVIFLAGVAAAQEDSLRKADAEATSFWEKMRRTVVAIEARRGKGGSFIGTGVLISSDGEILTVLSVAPADSSKISVRLFDGRRFDAKILGFCERNRVVLLKLKGVSGLPYAKLGESGSVGPGRLAVLLASVYRSMERDNQAAMSLGVVTGVYRLRYGDGHYRGRVIEFDAAFNHGCDGAPLFDSRGRVIGIGILGYSYARWLGCAVPVDQIKYILDDLRAGAEVVPKYRLTIADEEEPTGGVRLKQVGRRGPAYKAGLRRNDVVLAVDGVEIETPDQLAVELTIVPPGTTVRFTVRRGEKTLDFPVRVGKYVLGVRKAAKPLWHGLVLAEKDGRLVVEKVLEDSPAAKAGLKKGDVVVEVEGKDFSTVEQFEQALSTKKPGDVVPLKVLRSGWARTFKLELEEKK